MWNCGHLSFGYTCSGHPRRRPSTDSRRSHEGRQGSRLVRPGFGADRAAQRRSLCASRLFRRQDQYACDYGIGGGKPSTGLWGKDPGKKLFDVDSNFDEQDHEWYDHTTDLFEPRQPCARSRTTRRTKEALRPAASIRTRRSSTTSLRSQRTPPRQRRSQTTPTPHGERIGEVCYEFPRRQTYSQQSNNSLQAPFPSDKDVTTLWSW